MKKAVALKYDNSLPAPFIITKGKRELADRICKIASENGITIVSDEKLMDSLFMLDVGTFIPEYLYELIANLLAFVYAMDSETGWKPERLLDLQDNQ